MVKRIIGEPCVVPINFRVSETMKKDLDSAADSQNISTTEYIRRAIAEKLARESSLSAGSDSEYITRADLRAVIREELLKMETETK